MIRENWKTRLVQILLAFVVEHLAVLHCVLAGIIGMWNERRLIMEDFCWILQQFRWGIFERFLDFSVFHFINVPWHWTRGLIMSGWDRLLDRWCHHKQIRCHHCRMYRIEQRENTMEIIYSFALYYIIKFDTVWFQCGWILLEKYTAFARER